MVGELALVGEAGAKSDVRQGQAGSCLQDLPGPLYAAGDEVLAWSYLEIGGQLARELRGRNLLAPAGILARPQRREITAPQPLGTRAQGGDAGGGQWEGGRRRAERPDLPDDPVHDTARGPAGEHIGQGGVAGSLTL